MDFAAARTRILIAALGLIASLAACMTATPYQPDVAGHAVSGGYSEERLADDRWRVVFSGNELTSRDRVEGYMLYRAAELTLEQGYDSFVIIDRLSRQDRTTYVSPDFYYNPWYGPGYPYWRPHWRYYRRGGGWLIWHPEGGGRFWAESVDMRSVERFRAEAEIVMHRGAPSADDERAFDARRVIADLGPTIERPEDGR